MLQFPAGQVSVRTPGDVLALVPYLLGYHPSDGDLVAVGLRGTALVIAARAELPAAGTLRLRITARLDAMATQLARSGADVAVVIGYAPAQHLDPVMTAVVPLITAHGIRVHECLRVSDGRYWSYRCTNSHCCPPEGTAFEPRSTALAAQLTVAGRVALPNRAAIADRIAPVEGTHCTAMTQATRDAVNQLHQLISAVGAITAAAAVVDAGHDAVITAFDRYEAGERLSDDEAAWLIVLLTNTDVRDDAWRRIDGRDEHLQLWSDLTRRAEAHLVAAPASLLAFAAWSRGDGALANIAVARALDAVPAYSMGNLIADLLDCGMPPSPLDGRPDAVDAAPDSSPTPA